MWTNQRLSLGGHRGVSVASRFVQRPALWMHGAYWIWQFGRRSSLAMWFPLPGPNALHAAATQQPQSRHKRVRRRRVGADERLIEKKLGDDPSIQQWCETRGGLVEPCSIKGAPGRYKVTGIAVAPHARRIRGTVRHRLLRKTSALPRLPEPGNATALVPAR